MSPEGDIPLNGDGYGDDLPATLPNGTINLEEGENSDGDYSDDPDEDDDQSDQYSGYQLLSQDIDSENPPGDVADPVNPSGDQSVNPPSHLATPLPSQESQLDSAAFVSSRDSGAEQEGRLVDMATDEQIRTAMSGITLPPTNIPPWASTLDDGKWKEMLSKVMEVETEAETSQEKDPDR